ncbi:MAG: hypothetical protein ACK4N5_09860 [Myxococcales bacterium]
MARKISGNPTSGARLPTGREEAEERTRELTGFDATMDEAEIGDAGNGAAPYGADLTGGMPRTLEDEPDHPDDIVPDQIARLERVAREDDEREITAQPHEPMPIEPSELP